MVEEYLGSTWAGSGRQVNLVEGANTYALAQEGESIHIRAQGTTACRPGQVYSPILS